jgi:hypothetical protein
MNKVKIALASVVVAGSMVAGAAPAIAAPARPASTTVEQRIAAVKTWLVNLNLNMRLRVVR